MKNRYTFLIIYLLLSAFATRAQPQNNIWYFGQQAGLSFSGSTPAALSNGALATTEGSSCISDLQGNLLFYTDGRTVWNRLHEPMPNGTGLMGNASTTQAALIVPKPGDPQTFYIFTADAEGGPGGLCYSELDIRMNGGTGDLSNKNVLLHPCVTERLTAIPHQDGQHMWLITHAWNSDDFQAYLIGSNGINPNPVISKTGRVHTGAASNTRGQLKASPNGTRLAMAIYGESVFEFYDFDAATGHISNPVVTPPWFISAYGVEFSNDGTKVYGSTTSNAQLYQFDLTLGVDSVIASLAVQLNIAQEVGGQLQRGPDGRIYFARYNQASLGVIQYPDAPGLACQFQANGISLGNKTCMLGLPTFAVAYSAAINAAPEHTTAGQLVFYPNPSSGAVNVKYTTPSAGPVSLDILDVTGRTVHRLHFTQGPGEHLLNVPLDQAAIPNGTYLLKLQTSAGRSSGRLVRE